MPSVKFYFETESYKVVQTVIKLTLWSRGALELEILPNSPVAVVIGLHYQARHGILKKDIFTQTSCTLSHTHTSVYMYIAFYFVVDFFIHKYFASIKQLERFFFF